MQKENNIFIVYEQIDSRKKYGDFNAETMTVTNN